MTSRDDDSSIPAPGMRADGDHDSAPPETGPSQPTEEAGHVPPGETGDALEENASVRQAIVDDTSTAAFTEDDTEDDDGPLAADFQEPADEED
jgi:hypothetical protein